MTIMSGGIKAVSTVISYCNNPKIPKVHMTPTTTTNMEMKVALNDLKKKKKISEVTKMAAKIKMLISSTIF